MLSCFSLVWLCVTMDCNSPGSSVHGILQARILQWVIMPSSRGSSQPRDWTSVSCLLNWQAGSLPRTCKYCRYTCWYIAGSLPLVPPAKPIVMTKAIFSSVQFGSVTQLCPTLCNPMNCSMPGLPVHYQLPESTQTHAHRVGDAIQPSHPLSSPPPPAPNLSQHQGLFQSVSSSHQVAKVLDFQLQHQSFQCIFSTDLL